MFIHRNVFSRKQFSTCLFPQTAHGCPGEGMNENQASAEWGGNLGDPCRNQQ